MKSLLRAPFLHTKQIASLLFAFAISAEVFSQSNHTVTFSGSPADFNAAEKISAASGNTDYYITYDASNLYLGAFRSSGSFASSDNFTVYLDTDPASVATSGNGTTSGQSYNGVTGTLPFTANYNLHVEESTQEARDYSSGWASTISGPTYNTGSTWREVAIPFSSIGNPDALYLTMWMGNSGVTYSNAPGADLGGAANPTVLNYIGGFGVSAADCVPANSINTPITASLVDANPIVGVTYGKITITSGSYTPTGNFNLASGGSLVVNGGSLDLSGVSVQFGNAIGTGHGTLIHYNTGTLTTSAGSSLILNGEVAQTGNALTIDGLIRVHQKYTPLASGASTIGSNGILDLRAGGFLNTNSVTYSSGSTLKYNTGNTAGVALEWSAGAVSGTGIPHHVVIGDAVANSGLAFGSGASYRHAAGNVTISNSTSGNSLTLSSVAGGDLSIGGDFTQNGTFTHNNRSVTFNGSSTQNINGSLSTTGSSNNFRTLIINNTSGGVVLNTDVKIVGTSGDVLQITNAGSLSINATKTLTLEGNGGNILVSGGTRTIHFNASTSAMSITGTKTVTSASSGTLQLTSTLANGKLSLSAAVNFGNLITTIGNNTYLELLSGGAVTTNPPTYATGSTLVYNTGATTTASTEWQTGTTTGSGIPYHVLIGNGNNTTLSFGTSAAYRHANRNITISASSALTLSTVAGGDLQLRGDFSQNGTFTHNNRVVTLNGTSAQSVTGSLNTAGANNNFAYLTISNSNASGVTLNNDVLVSQTSGDVLSITSSGALNIASGRTLTIAGNGGNVRVTGGSRTINLNAASSLVLFSGTKTIASTSGGTLNFTSSAADGIVRLTAAVNFGSSITTIGNNTYLQLNSGGSVSTNAPIYASGSTLNYNTGAAFGRSTEWSATSGAGYPFHVLISNTGTALDLANGVTGTARQCAGNLSINNGCSLSMGAMTAALTVVGDLTIGGGTSGTLTLSSAANGNLNVGGDFNRNAGTFTHNNRTVTLNGSSQQTITGATTFYSLTLNNSAGALLNNATTVSNILTLTSGSFTLGNNNLTLSNNATGAITGQSASRMIITNGTGQLVRAIATSGFPVTYVFPVGDATGTTDYSPATFVFTANGAARNIGINVVDGNHPQLDNTPVQTDYLSRYWQVSNSAASTYTYNASFNYLAGDVVGAESNVRANLWNGSTWSQDAGSVAASNVLTLTTGLSNTSAPLGATAEFTGRVKDGAQYVWNQTGTANFTTAANWTPNRTTARIDDVLIFNNGATTTATNISAQTIGKLLISGNTNVSFTSAGSNTLTIGGNNGTDLSIASGSSLTISSSNALTIAFANSATTTVDGTLAITTNGSNAVNFTNCVATVNGSLNNFGIVTSSASSLTFSSTATYRHNHTTVVGTIPTATWNATSTCLIQGYTSPGANFTPGGLAQDFGHFTWNCASQTNDAQLNGNLESIAGNFTVSATNGNDLRLTDASSYTLNVGGNFSLSGANTELRMAQSNGTYSATMNVAGNYTQSTGSSTFNLNNGDGNTSGLLRVGGNFSLSAGTFTQSSGGTNAGNLVEFNGSANQAVTISGTISNAINFRLDNSAGMTLTGTLPIISNTTFYRKAGAITGGTISYSNTGSTLVYEGTTAMNTGVEFPSSNGPEDVTLNTTDVITLSASRTIRSSGILTLTNGVLALGNNDLSINNTASGAIVVASPSSTKMIATNGTGQLKRSISSAINLTFPVGDLTGTAEYSPFGLNFSFVMGTYEIGVRVVDDTSSVLSTPYSPVDYLSRYWMTTVNTGISFSSYIPSMTYDVPGDVNGTENNLQVAVFPQGASAWNHYNTNISSPTITKTGANLSDLNFLLNNAIFSGRTPVKYWNGSVSTNWSTSANWTPSGVPTSSDNVDFNGNATNPCILSGSATVNHLTMSDGGDLSLASGAALTIAGNFTHNTNSSLVFDCNSTLNLTNTTFNQTVPALTYGNLNLGTGARTLASTDTISICGNYTPTSGTVTTTGSTVMFMGTAAQAIQTNATSFNHLIISNTSANVNSAANVTVNGLMTIVPSARFNKSGGTMTVSASGDVEVNGYLRNSGATITNNGSINVNNGGVYEHNTTTPGTIPTATWNVGSLCDLIGNFSTGNISCGNQAFYDFRVNYTGNGDVNANESLTDINGSLTIVGTGTGEFALCNSGNTTINIDGNISQTGGTWHLGTTNNTDVVVVLAGDFSQTAGTFDVYTGGGSATSEIRMSGNYSRTGNGILTASGAGTSNALFRFDGTTQSITETSSGLNRWIDYTISSGSTTSLLSNLNIYGSGTYTATVNVNGTLDFGTYVIAGTSNHRVNINNGGTARTAHANGFMTTGASGSVQTTTRTYSSGATYVFNGTTNQNTGTFWTSTTPTANTVSTLVINNTGSTGNNTVTMNSGSNANVSSSLSFPSTNLGALDVLSNRLQITNSSVAAVSRLGQGHVIGDLQRAVTTGTNSYTFDIGTATGYSPVTINYVTVTNSGNAIARATDGAHPQAASHGLSTTSYVNRWWTITNSGITSSASTNIDAFSYQSADLIGGATNSSVKLARWNGTTWSYPSFTTGTNQISGTSLNNTTMYGQFFAADCGSFDITITPSAPEICNGGSVGLTASANFGSPTYSWSPSTGLSATNVAAVTANPSSTQTYTVTGTTATNCTTTESVTVTVNPRPTGVISGTQAICNGGSATLSIAVTGTGPWSGTLSNGAAFSGSTSPITVSVSPTSATTYTIATLVDTKCTALAGDKTGSAVVSVNARPTAVISGTQSICAGGSANLSIAVTGTGPWSGTLSSGASFSGSSSPITVAVSPSSSTTYTVASLTDANCSSIAGDLSGSAIVTINNRPTGILSGTQTICNGSSASLSIAVTGVGPWSGTLSNGASFSGASSPISVNVSPSATATITIATLSDSNCSANAGDLSGSAVITVNARPTGVLGGTQTVCAGSSAALYINVTGTGSFNGTLSPGAISFSGSGPMIVVNVTPTSTTTYSIASLSDANCSALPGDLTGSAILTYHALPSAGISGPSAICQSNAGTINFTGTANAVVTYTIDGGSNQFITLDGSGNATLSTGTLWTDVVYDLVSVNDGICSNAATGTVNITVNEIPEAEIDGSTSICGGSSTTISFYGNPGATVTYTINGGANQFITLNGSGFASFNTGALTSTTTYLLTSVSNGSCSQNIGMSAVVTITGSTFYQDSDGDGYGNPLVTQTACTAPVGYVSNGNDCCDTNADVNPGTEWWADADGDGFGGFVSDIGCVSGVDCNSATWPAQTIPYYPAAHGGASYVNDCQDNIATAYPGAAELCNNAIDDDCDGLINEGCAGIVNDNWNNAISVNLNNPNTHYPNCLSLNGTLVNANISPQGNASNVPAGAGRDVWYKFVAPSTGVQIKVVPVGFDAIIELQNSSAVEVNCETANTTSGGQEVLNYNALTPGQTYYVGVRNRDISVGGTFAICVSPLMPSGCSYTTPVGGFTMCSNFKAAYRGANSYTFSFTGTGGNAAFPYVTTSATTTGLVPFSTPALDIRHGGIYSVRVDANYSLTDGNGTPEPTMTVLGNVASVNCTGITIAPQPTLVVKSTQVCPAVLIRTNFLQWAPVTGNVNACGAMNFTYEFTKVSDCTGATAIGTPFEVTTNGNSQYLNLVAAFPSNLTSVGYWRVRIRPNYSYMTGTYGPTRVISVSGSSASMMAQEPQMQNNEERTEALEIQANIYPNPNHGEGLNVHLTGEVIGDVYIRIFNSIGQIVYNDMFVATGSVNSRIEFEQSLTSGFYSVEISAGGKTITERMLVEK